MLSQSAAHPLRRLLAGRIGAGEPRRIHRSSFVGEGGDEAILGPWVQLGVAARAFAYADVSGILARSLTKR